MRLKNIIPIDKDELDGLFRALKATRSDLADICGLSIHASSQWRKAGRIPTVHYKHLVDALFDKIKDRNNLTPVEKRALNDIERRKTLISANRTATEGLERSVFNKIEESPDIDFIENATFDRCDDEDEPDLKNAFLDDLTDIELVGELEKRGWIVNLQVQKK